MSHSPLIIVAPNGARRQKADHPHLPITAQELADEVAACVDAGAAMVHLHARDHLGQHSLAVADNAKVLDAVQRQVGANVVIQLTTEAVGQYQPHEQMQLIRELQPEAASFALSELIPDERYETVAADFFHWVASKHIIAQYILYSAEDLARYIDLKKRGVLPENRHHLLFVLGRYSAGQQSEVKDLLPFMPLAETLYPIRWAVCAFGQSEQSCLLAAAAKGGDVRIGFENNLYRPDGLRAQSNAQQVSDLVEQLTRLKKNPVNVEELRQSHLFL